MTVPTRLALACFLIPLLLPAPVPAQSADPARKPPASGSTLFRTNPGAPKSVAAKPDTAETSPDAAETSAEPKTDPAGGTPPDSASAREPDATDSPKTVSDPAKRETPGPDSSTTAGESASAPDAGAFPSGERTVSATVNQGNVRAEPTLTAPVVARMRAGDSARVLEERDDWFRVRIGEDTEGWAHKGLFGEAELPSRAEGEIRPGDELAVRVGTGNLRKAPDLEAEVVGRVAGGETVTVTEARKDWFAVRTADGTEGWTHWTLYRGSKKATIRAVRIERARTGEEKIHFLYDGKSPPRVFLLDTEHPRLVCDFEDADFGPDIPEETAVSGRLIWQIRSARRGPLRATARVVLDLAPEKNYEFQHFFVEEQLYTLIVAGD